MSPPKNESKPGTVVHQQASFKGPLPLPAHLEQYEQILPGLAERIVRMAEKSQDAATELNAIQVKATAFTVRTGAVGYFLGVVFGFLIDFFLIVFTGIMVYLGKDVAAILSGLLAAAAVVNTFRRHKKK